MSKLSLLVTALAVATTAVLAHAAPATGLHYGNALPLGAGTARAWVAIDVDGKPVSMGVSIDEKAMQSRPNGTPTEAHLPLPATVWVRPELAAPSRDASKSRPAFVVRYDRDTKSYLVVFDGFASPAHLTASR